MRERPNIRIYPRLRPVIAQRFFNRTGEEFLGSFWRPSESPANFKAARFTAYFFTSLTFLSYHASWDFFAISKNNGSEELLALYQIGVAPSNRHSFRVKRKHHPECPHPTNEEIEEERERDHREREKEEKETQAESRCA